jgi:hypothetical protein
VTKLDVLIGLNPNDPAIMEDRYLSRKKQAEDVALGASGELRLAYEALARAYGEAARMARLLLDERECSHAVSGTVTLLPSGGVTLHPHKVDDTPKQPTNAVTCDHLRHPHT